VNEGWNRLINIETDAYSQGEIQQIPIRNIRPNPFQPRKVFPEEKIAELMQSIKTYGLLHPIIVRKAGKHYELVAGERRLRACSQLKWTMIPAVVKNISANAMATIALIENLQREDLSYFEEAAGYDRLLREFNLTQEVLAQRLGKSQSTIANKLRLLKLPEKIKEKLCAADLSERHARALLKLPSEEAQQKILTEICNLGYTVKQAEKRIADYLQETKQTTKEKKKVILRDIRIFLNTIRQAVSLLENSNIKTEMKEKEKGDKLEIIICISKRKQAGTS
jgi:ParB family chromosome partitioning protein